MTATPLVGTTFFGIDISQLGGQMLQMRRRVSKRVLLLEFGVEQLLLAEACLTQGGIQLNHISRVVLPAEALERGVPSDPAKMAGLIQEICTEKKIPAHRVAVVLSPEVAFQRLVDLPAGLNLDEARAYLLDPAHGLQIPFPVTQTDFDLFPVLTPSLVNRAQGMQLYMLTAVPNLLIDRVIEMLKIADLELQLLEVASLSQLRSQAANLVTLASHQVELVLELLPECSNLLFVTGSGLLGSDRLAAIRDFPMPELDEDQTTAALAAGLPAESFVINDESYLPISDLDLRVLLADLKAALRRFSEMFPGVELRGLTTIGVNSSHPLLNELLEQALGLPVQSSRPLLAPGVAGFVSDEVVIQSGLGRLVGLALGLLPKDSLVTCPLHDLKENSSKELDPGLRIEELLDLEQEKPTDSFAPVSAVSGVNDKLPLAPILGTSVQGDVQAEAQDVPIEVQDDPGALTPDEDDVVFAEVLEVLEESDRWPTIGELPVEVEKDAVVSEEAEEKEELEEWPTIGELPVELEKGVPVSEGEEENDGNMNDLEDLASLLQITNSEDLDQNLAPSDEVDADDRVSSSDSGLMIPGLPVPDHIDLSNQQDHLGQASRETEVDGDVGGLGELRFADSGD